MNSEQPTCSTKKSPKRGRVDGEAKSSGATKKSKCSIEPLQLVDINDDCLESIFQYLRIQDLINIAAAHDGFIHASRLTFSRRCKDQWFYWDGKSLRREFNDNENGLYTGEIVVQGKKRVKQFFRHFTHSISKLLMQIRNDVQNSIDDRFVLEHCSAGLVELTLSDCSDMVLQAIDEPFKAVKRLCLSDDVLRSNLSQLSVWFPAMDTLILDEVIFTAHPDQCSQLKRLKINNESKFVQLATIKELLRLNPQLKSLELRCDYDADFLRSISEYLSKLEELSIFSPDDQFKSFGTQNVVFEHVNKFELRKSDLFPENFNDPIQLPFTFTNLQELTIVGFSSPGGPLLGFIEQNKFLKKLHLGAHSEISTLNVPNMKTLVKMLPHLVELQFDGDAFTTDDLIEFLSAARTLKIVQILQLEAKRADAIEQNKAISSQWIKHSQREWILVDGSFTLFSWIHEFQRKSI